MEKPVKLAKPELDPAEAKAPSIDFRVSLGQFVDSYGIVLVLVLMIIGLTIIQPKYFDNGFVPGGASHQPFIPQREISEWRVSDQVLKLKIGSLIGFKSADSGASKFQGAEKDWIHFDEEPPKPVYEESVIRVGAGTVGLRSSAKAESMVFSQPSSRAMKMACLLGKWW